MPFKNVAASWSKEGEAKVESETLVEIALSGCEKLIFEYEISQFGKAEMKKRVEKSKNHLEMVQAIRPLFSSRELGGAMKLCEKNLSKNDEIAHMLMAKAMKFENELNFQMALRAYNLAVCFAKSGKMLGEICRARSSLLFNLNHFDECIFDTKVGLSFTCPESLTQELRLRLLKCETITKYEKLKTKDPRLISNAEFRKNTVFRLKGKENQLIPGGSHLIEIKRDGQNSRGVFATGAIPAGTTLMIEDPYVSTLTAGLTWGMSHCWRCSKRIKSTIPCPNCVFAAYCSVECRLADMNQGHLYECPALPFFHGTNVDDNIHLGFKSICKAGPRELYKIYSGSKTYGDFRDDLGFDTLTKKYEGRSYLTVLNLIAHTRNNEKLPQLILAALSFVDILRTRTNFFDEVKSEGFEDFVASLALHNAISCPLNLVTLHHMAKISENDKEKDNGVFKTGIYPLVSLMNHSCDPNVCRAILMNGQTAIIASRDLTPGDELFMSYGIDFTVHSLKFRRDTLQKLYQFYCQCLPCSNNWSYLGQKDLPMRFRCPYCTDQFSYTEFEKCIVEETTKWKGKCRNCKKSFDLRRLEDEITFYPLQCDESEECLRENHPPGLIPILVAYTQFLQSKICPPSNKLSWAQWMLTNMYIKVSED